MTVSSDEAIAMAQQLARLEGVFCGSSSGCNVVAANKLAQHLPNIKFMVTMINDTGMRYLATPLFGHEQRTEVPQREHPVRTEDVERLAELDLHIVH